MLIKGNLCSSIISYQTLPRNMPSHRAQVLPRYPEGYRTLPRNSKTRPDSLCSVAPSVYDRAMGPVSAEDKRRSMRDDTMWQLYEWQQRQFYNKQTTLTRHGTLSSPKNHDEYLRSDDALDSHVALARVHRWFPGVLPTADVPVGSVIASAEGRCNH